LADVHRRHWSTRDIFLAAAIPASISAIAMFSLRFVVGPSSTRELI